MLAAPRSNMSFAEQAMKFGASVRIPHEQNKRNWKHLVAVEDGEAVRQSPVDLSLYSQYWNFGQEPIFTADHCSSLLQLPHSRWPRICAVTQFLGIGSSQYNSSILLLTVQLNGSA